MMFKSYAGNFAALDPVGTGSIGRKKMLDQLVESRSNTRENTRRTGFFATTFVILVAVLLGAFVYSLFAKDYGLDSGDLELSALVAPVPVPEEEPPPPPEKEPEQQKEQKTAPNADVRTEIISRWLSRQSRLIQSAL
jgi:hypothetical protein